MSAGWYEVWADEGHEVPYLMLLRPLESGFEILDPQERNKRVHEAPSYEDARMWLLDDEFVRVGRKDLDEP
jgi:hypothetical protein